MVGLVAGVDVDGTFFRSGDLWPRQRRGATGQAVRDPVQSGGGRLERLNARGYCRELPVMNGNGGGVVLRE